MKIQNNEHIILEDIPSGGKYGKFHSAILTTYTIDIINFDSHIINTLHRKDICSINILADQEQLSNSMDYVNPLYVNKIGKEYTVSGITSKGAFHPKINFFIGDESAMVVFGSGNLTVSGQGKNHEIFTGFWIDSENVNHRPLIEECWQYICKFTSQCSNFERRRIVNEIPDNCKYLDKDYKVERHNLCKIYENLYAALIYNEDTSILSQIKDIVPFDEVTKLTVVSPYFDENGKTLITLTKLCKNAQVEVLIQEDCTLPPCNIIENSRIKFFDFDKTKRGKSDFNNFQRKLHAKIIHFKTKKYEYCIIGSANATIAGLGTLDKRGINDEFCVIYSSDGIDFLGELDLKNRKVLTKQIKDMRRINSSPKDQDLIKYNITCADYENGKLSIIYRNNITEELFINIDNGIETYVEKVKPDISNRFIVKHKLDVNPALCFLTDINKNRVSNKVFINKIEYLETTNPSQTSRSINRFISQIENEGYDGLDVADMISDIMLDFIDDSEGNEIMNISVSGNKSNKNKLTLPNIKYNKDYDNDEIYHNRYNIDRTSKLIDCIEESIKRKIRSIDDDIKDEEELGNSEESHDRTINEDDFIVINTQKKAVDYGKVASKILEKYSCLVEKRQKQNDKTGKHFVTKDDLNFFSLSLFASSEIGYLNRNKYIFTDCDKRTKGLYQKDLYDSLDRSMQNDALKAIKNFKNFCLINSIPFDGKDEDYNKKAFRAIKYAVLYATLFYKFASESIENIKGKDVDNFIKVLFNKFGKPEINDIITELEPISERYDFIFRTSKVKETLSRIINT